MEGDHKMTYSGGKIKKLGFGLMRLPQKDDVIDVEQVKEMEFVQLQINYADWENPAVQSRACYETARKHGKPVIIMEPVKGGMLATPPKPVEEILKSTEPNSSATSWGVRFAADLEGVITVLSGMSSVEQMQDNLSYMKDFSRLTDTQRMTLKQAQEALGQENWLVGRHNKARATECIKCGQCEQVCPQHIAIREKLELVSRELLK
jgi:predicted aldo/keto reductase-like oxidoreductase